ncbi:MAG: DUF692 family protein [Myxococcales bacterium]|nr:DUF692 family protein [Myxococcales bacterium]
MSDSSRIQAGALGVGVANDLCEPGVIDVVTECYRRGLCQYLTVYAYENYSRGFMERLKAQLPAGLKYVWHASGDFELPFDGTTITANWSRIHEIVDIWRPEWATEDVIVTNFARSRPQGHPNYVQPFLTEECLSVCIRRMREVSERVPVSLFPEVPHFYMPGPDEMHLSTFFRSFVEATGATLNFDVGHFFSYNLLHRRPLLDRIDEFPLSHVGEINTAGGMFGDPAHLTWVDDYTGPLNPITVEALQHVIPRCTNLRAVYTETIGAEPWVLFHNLEILNDLFPAATRARAA